MGYDLGIGFSCCNQENNLRKYELSNGEWEIVRQLREVLKVRPTFVLQRWTKH